MTSTPSAPTGAAAMGVRSSPGPEPSVPNAATGSPAGVNTRTNGASPLRTRRRPSASHAMSEMVEKSVGPAQSAHPKRAIGSSRTGDCCAASGTAPSQSVTATGTAMLMQHHLLFMDGSWVPGTLPSAARCPMVGLRGRMAGCGWRLAPVRTRRCRRRVRTARDRAPRHAGAGQTMQTRRATLRRRAGRRCSR